MTQAVLKKTSVLFIFITVLIDIIGLGIIIPVIPELIMELTGKDISHASLYGGWLGFTYALMQFFFAAVLGGISDRIGRRPVILFSLFSLGVDYLIMGFARSITWLFVGRALSGIAGASFIPAYAYLADVSPPEKRAQNFGLVGAAFGCGFIIGPAVGGFLGEIGPRVPFFAAAALALVNVCFGLFVLPESLPKDRRRHFDWKRANPVGTLLQIRTYPLVGGLALAIFLWQLGHQVMPSTWAYYSMFRFGWSEAEVGASLAAVGVIFAISQGGLTRVVIPKLGERRAASIGLVFAVLAYMGYALSTQGWMVFVVMLLWFPAALVYPSMNALMSRQVPANAQGELQGAIASLFSIASTIGPPMMTQIFGRFSPPGARVHFPGAAFACAAGLAMTSAFVFARTVKK
jgi:DHA1 family tetracycline resistance protein-like MFS transporter